MNETNKYLLLENRDPVIFASNEVYEFIEIEINNNIQEEKKCEASQQTYSYETKDIGKNVIEDIGKKKSLKRILALMKDKLLDAFTDEIKAAKYFSIIVDFTPDISQQKLKQAQGIRSTFPNIIILLGIYLRILLSNISLEKFFIKTNKNYLRSTKSLNKKVYILCEILDMFKTVDISKVGWDDHKNRIKIENCCILHNITNEKDLEFLAPPDDEYSEMEDHVIENDLYRE
ncbi:hypothetical protein ALC53_04625 [Atta colombica]|uniref:Uncharacterized protein n=1 Tax=Atta colombica TaxID=520822 RepID=A0A195BL25_9HYME|nr:hypothetical protein ALC53_04625 [Atta colombica]